MMPVKVSHKWIKILYFITIILNKPLQCENQLSCSSEGYPIKFNISGGGPSQICRELFTSGRSDPDCNMCHYTCCTPIYFRAISLIIPNNNATDIAYIYCTGDPFSKKQSISILTDYKCCSGEVYVTLNGTTWNSTETGTLIGTYWNIADQLTFDLSGKIIAGICFLLINAYSNAYF
jgi:hypothetical protein